MLEKMGYEPLPTPSEPHESPISNPDLAREFPLILTTGSSLRQFTHSRYRTSPKYLKMYAEPLAEAHPDTPVEQGIGDGEMVFLETKRGA
jgi:anaerobic selenocysteine-containing dehydrogenase